MAAQTVGWGDKKRQWVSGSAKTANAVGHGGPTYEASAPGLRQVRAPSPTMRTENPVGDGAPTLYVAFQPD